MKKIPIAHPSITKNEINLVYDAIKNGWGNKCFDYIIKFEKLFSKKFNVNYSIATSSCTGAIHIALKSMGIGRGDEVIVPESTWISCASAIEYVGAKPVFADILEDTWCINPKDILKKINKRTKAIIPVHVYGSICEMDEINKIAKKHKLYVIEDAAEAIGSKYKKKYVGTLSDCGVFSFHGTKTITTGEGGMLVTNNRKLYAKFKIIHDQGRVIKEKKMFFPHYTGLKYKISNIQAALGCAQLKRLNHIVNKKRQIFNWYSKVLKKNTEITLNAQKKYTYNSYWKTTIVFDQKLKINKEKLINFLKKYNIDSRPFFYPLSSLPMYKKDINNKIAYKLSQNSINLPSFYELSEKQVKYICNIINKYINNLK